MTFEGFKVGQQQVVQPSKVPANPFTAVPKQPAAAPANTRMMDQIMSSPDPVTPASVSSESRGAPAGPPLTTLASLSKMPPADSGTVTPMTNMHASHVPLSTYSGTPAASAAAGIGSKAASKIVWGDVLMWRQPMQTATLFVAGLAAFALLNFAAYGAHKMTLMSGKRMHWAPRQQQQQQQYEYHEQPCLQLWQGRGGGGGVHLHCSCALHATAGVKIASLMCKHPSTQVAS
jgi:hypothetical protein